MRLSGRAGSCRDGSAVWRYGHRSRLARQAGVLAVRVSRDRHGGERNQAEVALHRRRSLVSFWSARSARMSTRARFHGLQHDESTDIRSTNWIPHSAHIKARVGNNLPVKAYMINRRYVLLAAVASVGLASKGWSEETAGPPTAITPVEPPHPKLTPTEFLMHATVRIQCTNSQGVSIGTGFLFHLFHQGNQSVPVMVSNKHVIKGAVTGSFELTMTKSDETPDLTNHFPINITDFEQGWIGHPDDAVDLAIFPCGQLLERLAKEGRKVFWTRFDQTLIPTEDVIRDLTGLRIY
jgi:hypothetical protein